MRAAAILALLAAAAAGEAPLRWGTDLDAALAEAKEHGRPVLVYVYDDV